MAHQNSQLYYPTDIAIKMTNYCPNNCYGRKYCFAENSSDGKQWIDRKRIKDIFQQAKECGLINLLYFSCEPFADFNLLLFITKAARDAGLKPRFLDTSGYRVGKSLTGAENHFKRLKDAGFDITLEKCYIGTEYNGIDVSVDQFHPISPQQCANTILGALHVFGPTEYVNMRITHPSLEFNDDTNKNRTIELLIETGEVVSTSTETHELFFKDGSSVCLNHLIMHDDGFAERLAKEKPQMFSRHLFSLEQLDEYKDLREPIIVGKQQIVEPFHKLYIDPDGQTYPALSRLKCLSGGNIYKISVQEAVSNINNNPLLPVFIAEGLAGVLKLIEKKTLRKPLLYATGPSTIGTDFLEDEFLMEQIKSMITEQGLDEQLRTQLVPSLSTLRERISKSS